MTAADIVIAYLLFLILLALLICAGALSYVIDAKTDRPIDNFLHQGIKRLPELVPFLFVMGTALAGAVASTLI